MSLKPRDNLPLVSPRQSMTTYDLDYGGGAPRVTPIPVHDTRLVPVSRLDLIEDRLITQERTTQSLLERAYRIKEDIIENLNITHGSWNEEKRQRELLQDHIRTITDIVKKLGSDIQVLENQLRTKDGQIEGASSTVKNLELNYVGGITDLRGRVVRCDTAIGKLAADIRATNDAVKQHNTHSHEQDTQLTAKLQAMNIKITEMQKQMEAVSTTQQMRMSHMEGDTSTQMASLDQKSRMLVEDTRNTMHNNKLHEEQERGKLEARVLAALNEQNNKRDARMDKLEKTVEEKHKSLRDKIQKLEDDLKAEQNRTAAIVHQYESHMNHTLDDRLRSQNDQLQRLKRECREGLTTLHDSLGHMKQVTDGKRQILEEQLRKEISQIRKMVVLI